MTKIKRIVVATRNPAKKKRYGRILVSAAEVVLGLDDLNITDKPAESAETAEENAEIKAKFYSRLTNLPVFSEDESLFVDFLPKSEQPGVHVRRINRQDEVDDDKLLAHWKKLVSNVPMDKRTGRWHIAYCLATPDGRTKTISRDHHILFFSPTSNVRLPGWPMSSLEGPVEFGKPHSEMTQEEHDLLNKEHDQMILDGLKELVNM